MCLVGVLFWMFVASSILAGGEREVRQMFRGCMSLRVSGLGKFLWWPGLDKHVPTAFRTAPCVKSLAYLVSARHGQDVFGCSKEGTAWLRAGG